MPAGNKKNKFIPGRSFFIIAACMTACVTVLVRLFYLQVMSYDKYNSQVADNIRAVTTVPAERGLIYDRNMTVIASNKNVYRVFINPRKIADDGQAVFISNGLSEILGVDYQTVYENAKRADKADRTVKKNVEEEDADKVRAFIEQNGLEKQILLEQTTARNYPYGSLASNVIGFVGTDGGLLGLELQYDTYLTGVPGRYVTAKDAHGGSLSSKYETYIETKNGANLISTIDITLQRMLENELAETYVESIAQNRVTGIVMDVNTGAILAMATYPDFDLNSPYTLDKYSQAALDASGLIAGSDEYNSEQMTMLYRMWKNKAVSELYEPGSTFKIITVASAVEEKAVAWDDMFNCTGVYMVSKLPIHCHKLAGHGEVTLARGLQQSCNPTLMMTIERLGKEKFFHYFEAFGYTEKTGIDLPGEASAIYTPYDNISAIDLAISSFGQGCKVTPIQQLTAICAVANGGYLVNPYVVSQAVDEGGNIVYTKSAGVRRQVISTETCRELTDVLEKGVSTDGAAKNAYVPGYKIAAKTGTSEVRDILNEKGETYLRVGSCVGYAPAEDPQIAVLIVVDQPQCDPERIYGSYVAAPYVASFLNQALPYIGVERNYTKEELANLALSLRNYVGWPLADSTLDLSNRGVTFKVEGDGDIVTYQIPAAGSSINKNSAVVILYTGNAQPDKYVGVPDVLGRSAAKATSILTNAGLNILLEGSINASSGAGAVVIEQSPAAGEKVEYGAVITVTMRHLGDTDG